MVNKNTKNIPELVAPAGDWPSLESAINAGADAVYFGLKTLSMRKAAANFDLLEIKKVISLLHSRGCRGYLALNTIVYEKEASKLEIIIQKAKQAKVDGIICWDMAVVSKVLSAGVPVHLSTQASVSNFTALRFFSSLGVKRIVLARECSLADIAKISASIEKEKIDCQLEAFVHGSMCVSISGRCFLSHDLFGKSANRGECAQPCRREFFVKDVELGVEYVMDHGSVMSAQDLCMIDFVDKLIEAGLGAFKIEGRMRTPEYIAVVTGAYRKAIDAYRAGTLTDALKSSLKKQLAMVYNRGFSTGFYFSIPPIQGRAAGKSDFEKTFIGEIDKFYRKIHVAQLVIRNGELKEGDQVLVFGKTTPASSAVVSEIQVQHKPVTIAKKGALIGIKLPFSARPKDKVFLLKSLDKEKLRLV